MQISVISWLFLIRLLDLVTVVHAFPILVVAALFLSKEKP